MALVRSILSIVLAIVLIAAPNTHAASDPLKSIAALELHMEMPDESMQWVPVCTAWATRSRDEMVWVTAGHCIRPNGEYRIGGKRVTVRRVLFKADGGFDGAILTGGPRALPFLVGHATPKAFTPIQMAGYPHGSSEAHAAEGVVGSNQLEDNMVLLNIPSMGGISGAPVIEKSSGMVVSMIVQTECYPTSWCPYSRGVQGHDLKYFLDAGY